MSRDASIDLDWADGHYTFRLGWGELEELQEKTDAGPFAVLTRLASRHWRVQDIRETIRIGLIGGGTPPDQALSLVQRYVTSRPPMETLPIAAKVLAAAVQGAEDEAPGEADAAPGTESA